MAGKEQTVKAGDTTVKVAVDEKDKSDAELEKERHAAAQKAQKERAESEAQKAEQDERAAQARADEAKERADEARKAAKGTGKSAGGSFSKGDKEDLKEDQIEHGKAPIAPGPEQPVEPDDAKKAKENRGRGLGG